MILCLAPLPPGRLTHHKPPHARPPERRSVRRTRSVEGAAAGLLGPGGHLPAARGHLQDAPWEKRGEKNGRCRRYVYIYIYIYIDIYV